MKYYVVLDTNVVVSALFNISSVPGMILQEALAGRIIPLLHEDILDEYNDVLHRPKFKFDRRDIEIALTGLIKRGIFLDAATIGTMSPTLMMQFSMRWLWKQEKLPTLIL